MDELQIGLVDEGELNFDQSFMQLMYIKICMERVLLDLALNEEY